MVRLGCPVILMDEEKEAEGDLFCPAALATPEVLQFMKNQDQKWLDYGKQDGWKLANQPKMRDMRCS